MKNVFWFSRHEMTQEQRQALESKCPDGVAIHQVNMSIASVSEISYLEEFMTADIIAIVAPIGLQQQFLRAANGRPVIMAVSNREVVHSDDPAAEDQVVFHFVKWEQLDRIEVVKHDFA
jgi:hypothetical protein